MKEIFAKLKYILHYIKPFNLVFCFVSYFVLISSIFQLASAFLQQTIINVIDKSGINVFEKTVFYSIVLIVSAIILIFLGGIVKDLYIRKLEKNLLENIFSDFNKKAYEQIKKYHSGDLMTRLTTNAHAFVSVFQTAIFQLASNMFLFVVAFWYLSSIQLTLAILILLSGVITLIVGRFFDPRLKESTNSINKNNSIIRSNLKEIISNIEVVKSYECESYVIKGDMELRDSQLKHLNHKALLSSTLWNLLLAINDGFMIVAAFVLCIISIEQEAYIGSLIAFINLIGRVQWPFIDLSNMIAALHQDIISAKRTIEIIQLDVKQPTEIVKDEKFAIVCSGISYSYNENKVIDGINLKIEYGQRIGIAGKSGSGKSTFAKICSGLYNVQDGNIKSGKIIYIAQFPHLFSTTVFENIHIGNIDCSNEEVQEAINLLSLQDFVGEFEEGSNYIIREDSTNLSGGQSQKIAIARSVLCDAEIIILDEITASLDVETEKKILALVNRILKNKTLIFITHRKNVLEKMDGIFVFDKGRIVARGTHMELLNNSLYYSLINENVGE